MAGITKEEIESSALVLSNPTATTCSSPEEQVFNNEMLIGHILSKSKGVKVLRLVHPLWNNAILSNPIRPRLCLQIPLQPNNDMRKQHRDFLPLADIQRMEPRLLREVDLEEEREERGISASQEFLSGSQSLVLHWSMLCGQFSDSIQSLSLYMATDYDTLPPCLFLILKFCPNLKELMMCMAIDKPIRSEEDQRQIPTFANAEFEIKPNLKYIKFSDGVSHSYANDLQNITYYLRALQSMLNVAPNLDHLSLDTNFLPNLEKQRQLKRFVWKVPFLPEYFEHEDDDHAYSLSALCYRNLAQTLESCAVSLEEVEIRSLGLDMDCSKCAEIIENQHIDPLVLPKLMKLTISDPSIFMLDGGIGFKQFRQENLPQLDTLVLQGYVGDFSSLQSHLRGFMRQPGTSVITVRNLDLGFLGLETCEALSLSHISFPNLTTLKFCIDDSLGGDIQVQPDHQVNYHNHDILTQTLDNCSAITTLKSLNIKCQLNIPMSYLLLTLERSRILQTKTLPNFTLEFGSKANRRTPDTPTDLQKYAIEFAKCLRQTKHMAQVSLLNFWLPPTVLIPLVKTIERLKLPVSFGDTASIDQALEAITFEEEVESD